MHGTLLTGAHDALLVALSVAIAIAASYTALDLAGRGRAREGRARAIWLATAALAMGGGIWSMHFVAMLAFSLPVPVAYAPGLTLLSLAIPVLVSGLGLAMAGQLGGRPRDLLPAGLLMGGGIAAMHYTGMAAMRMPAELHHDWPLVVASVLIAVGAATVALWVARRDTAPPERGAAAVVMGLAVAGMHYTAMQAASWTPLGDAAMDNAWEQGALGQAALALGVATATFLILFLALIAALVDRYFAALAERKTQVALRESEARLRAAVEGSPFPIMLHAEDGEVLALSRSWTALSGYAPEEIPTHSAWFRLAYPGRHAELEALLRQEFTAGEVIRTGEQTILTKSGAERVWDFQAVPLGRLQDGRRLQVSAAVDVTERKQAEAELRRQFQLTEAITGNAAVALFIMDERQHCVFMNPAAERLTGFTLAEVKGCPLHKFIHHTRPDGSPYPIAECPINRALPENHQQQGEEVFVHKDGRFFPVAFTASPIRESGRPVGTIIEAQDITERKAAEAALRANEARLRDLLATLDLGASMARDLDGTIRFWSEGCARLYGWSAAEAVGRDAHTLLRTLFPVSRAEVEAALERAGEWTGDLRQWTRDGQELVVSARKLLRRGADGRPVAVLESLTDVTAQRRIEAALRHSRAEMERQRRLYEAILTNTPDLAFVLDRDHRFIYANDILLTLWGRSREEAIGKNFLELGYEPWHAAMHDREIEQVIATRQPVRGEVPYTGSFGRRIYDYIFVPVIGPDGEVEAVAGTTRDVTEYKRIEEALARHRDELERLVEERAAALLRTAEERRRAEEAARQAEKLAALGQLTGGVAHDFNNLLQVISSGAALLRRASVPEAKKAEILEGMIQAGRSARELTGRLLAFARRQTLRPELIDVGARLAGMSELLGQTLGSRIRVETEIEPDLWPVRVDASQLEVAILNLAVNARDAMPEGGTITIQARNTRLGASVERAAGDYVCIAVKDTGKGMPPHILSRVLEPFFTTKQAGLGTGLGLPQVHGFAKQSGGDLQIESEPGRGSMVFFHLPRAAAEGDGPARSEGGQPRVLQGVGRTVLVVEDNAEVAAFACTLLEELGYATRCSGSAAEALARLADGEKVDAVFSDVVMPGGISGVELAAVLRFSYPHLAVVLATGYSEQLARGGAPEGVETLTKPYHPDELAAALERAFAQGRGLGEAVE